MFQSIGIDLNTLKEILKQTSKKTTLLVGAASEVFVGNDSIKYQSSVACQQIK